MQRLEMKQKSPWLLYTLFAASGFSALVYEVLWTRYLSLIFGASMLSVCIVVGAFMVGLALGNYGFGRIADRAKNPLQLYALLELAIAASALALPALFAITQQIFGSIAPSLSQPYLLSSLRLILASLLLLPATICMGGTLPLMCRVVTSGDAERALGRLYAVNTAGAVLGCVGAGFYLIPWLGHQYTGYVAAAVNLLIAATVGILIRQKYSLRVRPSAALPISGQNSSQLNRSLVLSAVFVIGMSSLAFEVLWTRLFVLFLGNTTYAFSSILGVFLAGLTLGGYVYARWLGRGPNPVQRFIVLMALCALFVLIPALYYDKLAYLFLAAQLGAGDNWALLTLWRIGLATVVILPPAFFAGSLLPAGLGLLHPRSDAVGRSVGAILLLNTLGAVTGNTLVALLLIPTFGLLGSFCIIAMGLLSGAALLYATSAEKFRFYPALIVCVAVIGLAIYQPRWNPVLLNSGVYLYAQAKVQRGGLDADLLDRTTLFSREGLESTVAVFQKANGMRLFTVNGKVDGGTNDMSTQVLLGQLPMLVHPAPRSVLVIGLGTGITLAEVATHAAAQVEGVEISPEMVDASSFFSDINRDVLKSPNVRLSIQDARNFLLINERKYDVIISEPSNPWQVGNGNLFTREFYRLVASRLNPGGIFCQWYPLYDMPPAYLKIASATILDTFPNALVFADPADLIILASPEESPLKIDYLRLQEKYNSSAAKESLARLEVASAPDLLANFFFSGATPLAKLGKDTRINTDDLALFEQARPSQGQYLEENRTMLSRAQTGTLSTDQPLVNFGATAEAARNNLMQLSFSFAAGGRPVDAGILQALLARQLQLSDLKTEKESFDHKSL